ncbi:hypothetical protein HK097_000460 [Rhizophlyctis rosea]|uniref:Nitrite reductase [NAD(P)H] n=1 Tax=Rhizophlyctis rosea TaxID=64517 RepID=A0AAD5X8D0_9FUNG|nr:hypothetical protein HK097_000460 [Rhizophlyctis rosea]
MSAEAQTYQLMEAGPYTPELLHYVQNSGDVPKASWDDWKLTIEGLVKKPRAFTMAELAAMPSVEFPVTLTSTGIRRDEMKRSQGLKWGPGAIGTSLWKGVSLRHILELCNIDANPETYGDLFVCTDGGDDIPKGTYGTSFLLSRAMDPLSDVIIAYSMNGAPLSPDHGFPIRMIIPGFVGGRMVKWLRSITVTDKESSAYYHYHDNRVLPPPPVGPAAIEEATEGKWFSKPEYIVNECNINSVIVYPKHDEILDVRAVLTGTQPVYTLKGYAYSGGGRQVTRVEVSLDDGATWRLVDTLKYDYKPRHGDKYWCWFTWETKLEVASLLAGKEVLVRAWDSAQNTQPKDITWNLLGMMNNAWYRVKIHLGPDFKLHFQHPTNVGGTTPGWMSSGDDEEVGVIATPTPAPAATARRQSISIATQADLSSPMPPISTPLAIKEEPEALAPSPSPPAPSLPVEPVSALAATTKEACTEVAAAPLASPSNPDGKLTIIVVGLGMVGLRFCEKLLEYDTEKKYRLVVFGEESHLAYNRVALTSYFGHRSISDMLMVEAGWYGENNLQLHLGDLVNTIDTKNKCITSSKGIHMKYHKLILATGSSAFIPPLVGKEKKGVFVYRTVEDLENIIAHSKGKKNAVVVGGGLLGLEAAKACHDLGLRTSILERSPWLMRRQLDKTAGDLLAGEIAKLGLATITGSNTREILSEDGSDGVTAVSIDRMLPGKSTENLKLETDMVVLSCGIIPRDDLAKSAGLKTSKRGGILVDDSLATSDEHIFAIGECVVHNDMVYGLVAPGYDMADAVASNLCGGDKLFTGADMSTKLKLLGVHVASFGDYFASESISRPITFFDPFSGVYKRLILNDDGTRLLGGILIGDTNDYGKLLALVKSGKPLELSPSELLAGKKAGAKKEGEEGGEMDDADQVCSCNNVTKGDIAIAMKEKKLCTVAEVKKCTKAGTSCGGCMPIVTEVFNKEMAKLGQKIIQHLCEHFPYSRTELFEICKIKKIRTFAELIASHGKGLGCEICKPCVGSILASLYNDHVLTKENAPLQDTNDRFLANIQRDGTFSVVPRIAGGEISPDGLIIIGQIAKDYGLYTKITGGQRIDMFGARKDQLPDIWERLVKAGFETGHAYGKSLRTVKSCVGSEWCRYGMRDSVRFAIQIEHRYKGLRSPHKIKSAVSGCIRECAEAQNKDFGLIATDKGYNLYVCGNGGSKPKHSVLLAAEIPEDLVIKYIDRFLMYYISTADKLTRTARWLEKLPGGIEYLKEVVIDDKLGIAEELERQMQFIVDTYQDEWKTVVEDPVRRADFRMFVNTPETERTVELVTDLLGQRKPANWPSDKSPPPNIRARRRKRAGVVELEECTTPTTPASVTEEPAPTLPPKSEWAWTRVAPTSDFPTDGGAVVKRGAVQIAVFNFTSRNKWYATQNMCPHKRAFVLSQGILGSEAKGDDDAAVPKVSCPMHKKNFSLEDGSCLTGEDYKLETFDVRIMDEHVELMLPPEKDLDNILATELWMVTAQETSQEPAEQGVEVAGGCESGGCGDKKLEW